MANIKVDFNRIKGVMKPMHGVGQPPFVETNFSMLKYLKDAGIPYSRLHDVGGLFGGNLWVDIPNIFRDFDADENNPESYDFAFTDLLINALIENGVEPFFRLGVTIENYCTTRAYRIYPPKDNKKWAVICEHIIRHYTEGWANGFNHKITYWEIWNEPDNYEEIEENQMWRGTKEQFFELYGVASKHLKKCFPHLKIGGYASCGFYSIMNQFVAHANSSPRYDYFIEFFDAFLEYIKKNDCPLDFFSWHSYSNVKNNKIFAEYARKRLDDAGYKATETSCNEWNPEASARGTVHHAAVIAAMMLMFQDSPLDNAMFYDARLGVSVYGSMFHPLTRKPFPAYYAFTAFNRLYQLKNQVELTLDNDDIYAVAAKDGENACIVIVNPTGADVGLDLFFEGTVKECFVTTEGKNDLACELPAILPANSFISVSIGL